LNSESERDLGPYILLKGKNFKLSLAKAYQHIEKVFARGI